MSTPYRLTDPRYVDPYIASLCTVEFVVWTPPPSKGTPLVNLLAEGEPLTLVEHPPLEITLFPKIGKFPRVVSTKV